MKSSTVEPTFHNKTLYIFLPHQDDEIAIWPIWHHILKASNIYIFCVTNGEQKVGKPHQTRNIRNLELLKNLTTNGIKKENIFFVADNHPPTDQLLYEYAREILEKICALVSQITAPDIILTTASEGGHPDHDVTNFLIRVFSKKLPNQPIAFEFFWYSVSRRFLPFNFGKPEKITADLMTVPFSRLALIKTIKAILIYRSQRKTFFLLGPCFIVRLLLQPKVFLRKLDLNNTSFDLPPNSAILYERRGWIKFSEIKRKLNNNGLI